MLIALGERCAVLNLNDGGALGNRRQFARELGRFPRRFVLRLKNYGDADMMNFFSESGVRIEPIAAERKPLGFEYNALLKQWGGTHTAPFSCHHMYTRADSQWATEYEKPLQEHGIGFNSRLGEFIPGAFAYDAVADRIAPMAMPVARTIHDPQEFGDDWSEQLEPGDVQQLATYFGRFEHLHERFEFVAFRVGGREHTFHFEGPKGRGITFAAPRGSLMTSIRYEIFDDLLIGNFMQTTLHGGVRSLYPDFTPYVAKYGDNGRAHTHGELRDYFRAYRSAWGIQDWLDDLQARSTRKVRIALSANRNVYLLARRMYGYLKS